MPGLRGDDSPGKLGSVDCGLLGAAGIMLQLARHGFSGRTRVSVSIRESLLPHLPCPACEVMKAPESWRVWIVVSLEPLASLQLAGHGCPSLLARPFCLIRDARPARRGFPGKVCGCGLRPPGSRRSQRLVMTPYKFIPWKSEQNK